MNYIQVTSSNIKAIGYNLETMTLGVEYLNNTEYHYFDVPEDHYEGALNADSVGTYLNKYIKGKFRYKKVR